MEDRFIVQDMVRVAEDADVGSEQKFDRYYDRIYEDFMKNHPAMESGSRNQRSVRGRALLHEKEYRSFASYYERIRRMKPSGTKEDGIVRTVTALYNQKIITAPTDDPRKPFRHFQA